MSKEQSTNEIMYKAASSLLRKMLENSLITPEEHDKIMILNIETFSPELRKVYL